MTAYEPLLRETEKRSRRKRLIVLSMRLSAAFLAAVGVVAWYFSNER